tara:strand:- start:3347 stop:4162 length:816 start_codon:yes stop_codon:yes gene_type:complete
MKSLFLIIAIYLFFTSSHTAEFYGKFEQGNFILGKINGKGNVTIDNRVIKVTNDGFFVFGLGRDRKNDVTINILNNGENQTIVKKVLKKKYKVQRIDGLPKKQVTPPKEVYDRIKKDGILISKARAINSDLTFFKKKFILPIQNSIITGIYGSQRILNGKPRNPHYGLDFAANEGEKVKAMLDGTVTLSENNLYYTGGTLIFDHGHGVSTLYMHMKDLYVTKGQKIKQGDIIGTVGKTGRSTGPHLDIRLNWFEVKLDPASVLDLKKLNQN